MIRYEFCRPKQPAHLKNTLPRAAQYERCDKKQHHQWMLLMKLTVYTDKKYRIFRWVDEGFGSTACIETVKKRDIC